MREQLLRDFARAMHHLQDDTPSLPDPHDRATLEEEFSLELRTREREHRLVMKLDDAILRLGKGEYGYCNQCGEEIGLGRLRARPMATLCIDCKTLDELQDRHKS